MTCIAKHWNFLFSQANILFSAFSAARKKQGVECLLFLWNGVGLAQWDTPRELI